jgi:hypothetical protein
MVKLVSENINRLDELKISGLNMAINWQFQGIPAKIKSQNDLLIKEPGWNSWSKT